MVGAEWTHIESYILVVFCYRTEKQMIHNILKFSSCFEVLFNFEAEKTAFEISRNPTSLYNTQFNYNWLNYYN